MFRLCIIMTVIILVDCKQTLTLPNSLIAREESDSYNVFLHRWLQHLQVPLDTAFKLGIYSARVHWPDWCITPSEEGGRLVTGCFEESHIHSYLTVHLGYQVERECFMNDSFIANMDNFPRHRLLPNETVEFWFWNLKVNARAGIYAKCDHENSDHDPHQRRPCGFEITNLWVCTMVISWARSWCF